MKVTRDKFEQYDGEWTEREYKLLTILEEVSADVEEGDMRSLGVFIADILDLFNEV